MEARVYLMCAFLERIATELAEDTVHEDIVLGELLRLNRAVVDAIAVYTLKGVKPNASP